MCPPRFSSASRGIAMCYPSARSLSTTAPGARRPTPPPFGTRSSNPSVTTGVAPDARTAAIGATTESEEVERRERRRCWRAALGRFPQYGMTGNVGSLAVAGGQASFSGGSFRPTADVRSRIVRAAARRTGRLRLFVVPGTVRRAWSTSAALPRCGSPTSSRAPSRSLPYEPGVMRCLATHYAPLIGIQPLFAGRRLGVERRDRVLLDELNDCRRTSCRC